MAQPYRVLLLTQQQPYPAMGGGALRVWQAINLLSTLGELAVFTLFQGSFSPPHQPSGVHWHHCDLNQPRTYLDKLRRRAGRWRRSGHPRADWLYLQAGAQQLQSVLDTFKPTVIIIAEIWLYRYLPLLERYGCPLILDNHNVEGDASRYQNRQQQLMLPPQELASVRQIESDFVRRVQQVWLCSPQDCRQLAQLYGQRRKLSTPLTVIANGVDPDYYAHPQQAPPFHSPTRPAILFLGRFSYAPNAVAATALIEQIYPALKAALPQSQLWLVGTDPTEAMQQAAQDPNIVVTGRVADVRPYLSYATVMVVPLQQGSGTRLKLLEAFAAKCPVVSTAKGAEGLDVRDGQHLLLRESPAAMVEAVISLREQPQRAQMLAEAAYDQFLAHYAWPAVGQHIHQALHQLFP